MIHADCPGCGRTCEFADYLAGLTVVCKSCGRGILVQAGVEKKIPSEDPEKETTAIVPAAAVPAKMASPLAPGPAPILSEPAKFVSIAIGNVSVPEWAVEHASALLKLGTNVAEIEHRLMARGLTSGEAAAVLNRVLDLRVAETSVPMESERGEFLHRLFSGIVAVACMALGYWMKITFWLNIWMLLPLACIWFPQALAQNSQPFLRVVGWLLLLLSFFRRLMTFWLVG